ncbi:MAG: ferrochelatase [Actinobacteria bacterium]|uniref:Unannotated protein n=1 Tax=freshwater metagenome TaxID=449393 RepID=A0A6J7ECP9_9ZZZZ|nr:ferrochelatase [Actinomycetota bacterium]
MTIDAVLLASFGGPEGPDEVMPFLERVTAGRGVPRERLEEVSHHYLALGGVSPINAQNRLLIEHLRAEFGVRGIDLPIYWGNRNSAPFFADALREIAADGHHRVLAIATSAYSSYSGCRQYRENLAAALAEAGLEGALEIVKARPYFDRPGFVEPFAEGIAKALLAFDAEGFPPDSTHVFFTTHSIPTSMDETSGPEASRVAGGPGLYERQHLDAAGRAIAGAATISGMDAPDWSLVYQSRSGPPHIPWLGPDISDALREAAANGTEAAVVVPIGFVSDHVEVIWDLDNEAQETATELGMAFARVSTPGVEPAFVGSLVDLVEEATGGAALVHEPNWANLCSGACCPNARADLPIIVGG